jgi:UrcA family protein
MSMTPARLFVPAAMLLTAMVLPAAARAEQQVVTLHNIHIHPATPAAADRTIRKIDEAALNVCGATGALAEVKVAMRAGDCWKEAAGNAVRQSGDPLLAQAFARFPAAAR